MRSFSLRYAVSAFFASCFFNATGFAGGGLPECEVIEFLAGTRMVPHHKIGWWSELEKAALVSNEVLLYILVKEKPLHDLLSRRNTTDESLRERTLAVMNRFDVQLRLRPELRLVLTPHFAEMRLALALHDIGKPMALAADGHSERQKEFTIGVLDAYLPKWGIPQEAVALIRSIVSYDPSDGAYRFRTTLDSRKVETFWQNETKKMPSLKENHVAALRMLFFLSDGSFYPNVTAASFVRDAAGRLQIRGGDPMGAADKLSLLRDPT